jgi:hypothetical protein
MITINMDKAKLIGHKMRRAQREAEFSPFDAVIMKQIPGTDAQAAEVARQEIREKYADMQMSIDCAESTDELKRILGLE